MRGFKAFLLRGNVVDLAVAVVIGGAFTMLVTAFAGAFITPLIAVIFGKHDIFGGFSFTVNGVLFSFGGFINALVTFVMVAAIVYFFVVVPINWLIERARKEEPADPTTKKCPECLSEIPIDAKRCAFCGQAVAAQPEGSSPGH
jgi:large conductance mechanosensitive channel